MYKLCSKFKFTTKLHKIRRTEFGRYQNWENTHRFALEERPFEVRCANVIHALRTEVIARQLVRERLGGVPSKRAEGGIKSVVEQRMHVSALALRAPVVVSFCTLSNNIFPLTSQSHHVAWVVFVCRVLCGFFERVPP